MPKNYTIAVLEGDGIGPEIMAVALEVLKAIESKSGVQFELRHAPFGGKAYFDHGQAFPEETKAICDGADAILKGEKLVPHWRVHDGRGINLRRVFTEPTRFDLVLWIQGSATKPYLERGTLTKPAFWRRMQRTFRGNFLGFAIWFN